MKNAKVFYRKSHAVILTSAISFCACVLLGFFLSNRFPYIVDPDYGMRLNQLRLSRQQGEKPLLVALGSSRLQMGFNPELMSEECLTTYNFALAGSGPRRISDTAKRLHLDYTYPDILLVEIFPALFFSDISSCTENLSASSFIDKNSLLTTLGAGRFLKSSQRFDRAWKQVNRYGWMPYFHENVSDEKRSELFLSTCHEYRSRLNASHFCPQSLASLNALICFAELRHIKLYFVVMPESPDFQRLYSERALLQVQDFLHDLNESYRILDARCWFTCEADFADGHHMLRHTAKSFTIRLRDECLLPWLRTDGVINQ